MKILMIPSFFKDKYSSTLGSFFLDQAVALQKAGNDVTIIYPDVYSLKHFNDYINYKEKNELINGVNVYRIKQFDPFKYKIYGYACFFSKGCFKIIKKELNKKFDFDIIHAQNSIWAGFAAMKISRKYNIPYIITEHSSYFGYNEKIIKKPIKRKIKKVFQNADSIISVSKGLIKYIRPYLSKKEVEVIGNIVDVDNYKPKYKENNSDIFTFLTVAYLGNDERIKLKGIDTILDAAEILSKNEIKFKMKIVGVPNNYINLNRIISKKDLNNYVEIIEPLDRTKIVEQMKNADCFVMPSKYETFGLVYAEAVSTGIPIIATDVGITNEIISEETGLMCEKDNPGSLANCMEKIMKSKNSFSPQLMHNIIVEKYSEKVIINKILNVYNKIIKKD